MSKPKIAVIVGSTREREQGFHQEPGARMAYRGISEACRASADSQIRHERRRGGCASGFDRADGESWESG